MKTRRFITMILCLFAVLSLLTSCSGYNTQMRNHLSDEANYHSFCGIICDIYYFDAENKKVSLLESDVIPDCDVVVELTFDERDTIKKFLGSEPNSEWSLTEYRFAFDITKENNQILVENGFYDIVSINTPIEITASNFIYMDSNFFFIAAVTYNETTFLTFEDGIQNIREFINEHKSLL